MAIRRAVVHSSFPFTSTTATRPLSSYSSSSDIRRNAIRADGCANVSIISAFRNELSCNPTPMSGRSFSTATTSTRKPGEVGLISSGGVFSLMRYYEDVMGVTDVREAQRSVLQAERDFERSQSVRRTQHDQIRQIQLDLKDVHTELDKTSRGEDRYLDLLTREHALIKREQSLVDEFRRLEQGERDCFNILSARLRESHEKERERAERTKYWSIIGSAVGALMGIAGATINNRLRLRELRDIVQQNSDSGRVHKVITQLSDMVDTQQKQVTAFINDLKTMVTHSRSEWNSGLTNVGNKGGTDSWTNVERWLSPVQGAQIMRAIQAQEKKMEGDMQEMKKLIAAKHGYSMKQDGTIVYVGPEMRALLDQTEGNIETKLKMNTLVTVVAIYGAFALTFPLLYFLFKGP